MVKQPGRRRYAKPSLQRRRRLIESAEGNNIVITGGMTSIKGGCFSNNR